MTTTREYLHMMLTIGKGKPHMGAMNQLHEYILTNGTAFDTLDVSASLALRKRLDAQDKQCYYNAQRAVTRDPSLMYCEGFGNAIIPVNHAWVTHYGEVIDPTWVSDDTNIPNVDYIGVRIDYDTVLRYWRKYETSGPILPVLLAGWPDVPPL